MAGYLTDDTIANTIINLSPRFWQWIPPNLVTLAGGAVSLLTLNAVNHKASPLLVTPLLAVRWAADVLDGNLARRFSRVSRFGGFLDTVSDTVFLATVPVAIFGGDWRSSCLVAAAIITFHSRYSTWTDHQLVKAQEYYISPLINYSYVIYMWLMMAYLVRQGDIASSAKRFAAKLLSP